MNESTHQTAGGREPGPRGRLGAARAGSRRLRPSPSPHRRLALAIASARSLLRSLSAFAFNGSDSVRGHAGSGKASETFPARTTCSVRRGRTVRKARPVPRARYIAVHVARTARGLGWRRRMRVRTPSGSFTGATRRSSRSVSRCTSSTRRCVELEVPRPGAARGLPPGSGYPVVYRTRSRSDSMASTNGWSGLRPSDLSGPRPEPPRRGQAGITARTTGMVGSHERRTTMIDLDAGTPAAPSRLTASSDSCRAAPGTRPRPRWNPALRSACDHL